VFYKLIGFAVWKMARAYIRQNYGQRIKAAAGFGAFLAALGAGYWFLGDDDDE
jgi:hypothetical protein